MRYVRWLLPHLTVALSITVFIVLILDGYNPMMGFLVGRPFQVLLTLQVIASVTTALLSMFRKKKTGKRQRGKYEKE